MAWSTSKDFPLLRPMSRDSLAQRVANAVKAFIVARNLEPGSQLPSERQLSDSFAVSRNIVREGLSALVAEGIIVKKPGSGVFIREFDRDSLTAEGEQVLTEQQARYDAVREARAAVELGAIGLIVSRITPAELDQLEDISVALETKADRGEPFFRDDMRFHLTLLRAARNELLLQWSPMVEEVMRTWSYRADALDGMLETVPGSVEARRVAAEHRSILRAVRQKKADEARTLLKEHLQITDL